MMASEIKSGCKQACAEPLMFKIMFATRLNANGWRRHSTNKQQRQTDIHSAPVVIKQERILRVFENAVNTKRTFGLGPSSFGSDPIHLT